MTRLAELSVWTLLTATGEDGTTGEDGSHPAGCRKMAEMRSGVVLDNVLNLEVRGESRVDIGNVDQKDVDSTPLQS